jgi:nucleotide-binding universal stress UspA family protein
MFSIHAILHPTDFSPQSMYAFHLACALARDHGARLLVAHVLESPPVAVFGEFGMAPVDLGESRADAQAKLDYLEVAGSPLAVERFLLEGDPAPAILEFAQRRQCSLIVMGTHGRTGLERLLMGSVAEQIVRASPCPVLTVKAPLPELATAASLESATLLAE